LSAGTCSGPEKAPGNRLKKLDAQEVCWFSQILVFDNCTATESNAYSLKGKEEGREKEGKG